MNLEFSKTRKSPRTSVTGFKPTVTSTDKMNLNFNSMATPSNVGTKTPKTDPRKSTGSMLQRKSLGMCCLKETSVSVTDLISLNENVL